MANGETSAKLKQLNEKIIEWVKLYQASGGRKKLPQETVGFFEQIKTAILPQTQQAIKKQATTTREQGPVAKEQSPTTKNQEVVAAKKLSGSVGVKCDNKSEDVKLVQELLNKNGASLTEDGKYGNNTLTAIKAYQQKTFGWADGAISATGKTAKALLGTATPTETTPTDTAPTSTTTTTTETTTDTTTEPVTTTQQLTAAVGAGTSPNNNADVKLVQELLNKNGASLTEDGKYGNNTLTAIKAYQASIGLGSPDGIIGVDGKTWKALVKGEGGIGKVTIDTSKLSEDTGIGYNDNDKDTYRDQRDNPLLGDTTCNVTTLAMQLISLASGNETELRQTTVDLLKAKGKTMSTDTQLEELLRQLCIAHNGGKEYVKLGAGSYKCWQVAYILDQVSEMFTKYVGKTVTVTPSLDKAGYDAKVVPALKEGAEIMVSNKLTHGGHIVKLASVRPDGVVLNDPYGCLVTSGNYLRNGEKLLSSKKSLILNNKNILEVRLQTNSSLKKKLYDLAEKGEGNLPGDTGKLNFYSWDEVKTYKIGKWINITYKK